jgi:dihydroflavonol-4-reductase
MAKSKATKNSEKTVLITGANGFVGRYTVERFLREGFHVKCMVRNKQAEEVLKSLDGNISFCYGDITQPDTLDKAFEGTWGVVNLAGYREFWSKNPDTFYNINETGAKNVFLACLKANAKKVIQVSTPLAFGVPETIPFNEESVPGSHPSHYARSKYLGDSIGWSMHEKQGLPLSIVYLAAVIGAGDDKSTMEVKRAVDKKVPVLIGADTTYTYLYVKDAAEAIVQAFMKEDSVGERYLIGGERATTREYFKKIGTIAGVPTPDRNIDEKYLFPIAKSMEFYSRFSNKRPLLPLDVLKTTAAGSLIFDGSKAEKELGLVYTPLDTALTDAVNELKKSA